MDHPEQAYYSLSAFAHLEIETWPGHGPLRFLGQRSLRFPRLKHQPAGQFEVSFLWVGQGEAEGKQLSKAELLTFWFSNFGPFLVMGPKVSGSAGASEYKEPSEHTGAARRHSLSSEEMIEARNLIPSVTSSFEAYVGEQARGDRNFPRGSRSNSQVARTPNTSDVNGGVFH